MALTKVVNGERVEMTAEEEAQTLSEWTQNQQRESEQARQFAIRAAANQLVAAASSPDPTLLLHKLMRGLKRVRKESRGRADQEEVSELNELERIADYIEGVRSEESRLLENANLTVDDASWPTL